MVCNNNAPVRGVFRAGHQLRKATQAVLRMSQSYSRKSKCDVITNPFTSTTDVMFFFSMVHEFVHVVKVEIAILAVMMDWTLDVVLL